jgi:uncharacterized membrane protein
VLDHVWALGHGEILRWRLVAGAALVALIYAGFRARADVAERMGFTDADVALITVGALAAPVLSVPVWIVGGAVFAVNLGGALVPLIVAWRLYRRGHLPLGRTLAGAVPVAAATFHVVDVQPGVGVIAGWPEFLAPAGVALVVGLVMGGVRPDRAGPIALAAGSLGALVGADLVTLPELLDVAAQAPAGSALVLGGGGSFDLVFLAGAIGLALSLALTLVATEAAQPRLGARRAGVLRVPAPRRVLSDLDELPGWTPRERALASLARANLALASDREDRAMREAREAVDALLRSGSPPLLERVREGEADEELVARLTELDERGRAPTSREPWSESAETVEQAKHVTGRLWAQAPGRVRVEGWRL